MPRSLDQAIFVLTTDRQNRLFYPLRACVRGIINVDYMCLYVHRYTGRHVTGCGSIIIIIMYVHVYGFQGASP